MTGRGVLVVGPAGRLARDIAQVARDRGACVALATPNGSESEADEAFERAAALIPRLDTVIIVSAVEPLAPVHELSVDRWRESAAEPLRRVFWLVRRAVEGFLADAAEGRLVLVVERMPEGGGSNVVVESALRSLARSFAREYGRRGLACNLVLPAGPHDPRSSVVEQVLFLASPAASFVNGEAVVVRCPPPLMET
jgi:NAD(P)-dependent dehydrogenase (short-subunit alcohol dehydrogenase family)